MIFLQQIHSLEVSSTPIHPHILNLDISIIQELISYNRNIGNYDNSLIELLLQSDTKVDKEAFLAK